NEALHARGFVAIEQVESLRTQVAQMRSRVASDKASWGVLKQKTNADRAVADNTVRLAQANLAAADANKYSDVRMLAEKESAFRAQAQAQAALELAVSRKRQTLIQKRAVQEAQAALDVAKHQLEYQMAQMDKAVIKSPIEGTVVSIAAQQGETVAASFAVPTLI